MRLLWIIPSIMQSKQDLFVIFEETVLGNPLKAEYILPIHIGGMLQTRQIIVSALETKDKWFGVTYKEAVVDSVKELINNGVYEKDLYSDL